MYKMSTLKFHVVTVETHLRVPPIKSISLAKANAVLSLVAYKQ